MLADGVTDVVVQPTHLLNGVENDAMIREAEAVRGRFQSLRIGAPSDLPRSGANGGSSRRCSPAVGRGSGALYGPWDEHYANAVYAALDYRF